MRSTDGLRSSTLSSLAIPNNTGKPRVPSFFFCTLLYVKDQLAVPNCSLANMLLIMLTL